MQVSHHNIDAACRGARPDGKVFVVEAAVYHWNVFVAEAAEYNTPCAVQIEQDCGGIRILTLHLDRYPLSVEQVGDAVRANRVGKS
jgi:hypothetical protein